jgi:hypothetical protein
MRHRFRSPKSRIHGYSPEPHRRQISSAELPFGAR